MINRQPVNKFGSTYVFFGTENGRFVYCKQNLVPVMRDLEKDRNVSYHLRYIYNAIKSLQNVPNPANVYRSRSSHEPHYLNLVGAELHYRLCSGVVYIDRLRLTDGGYQADVNEQRTAGLYAVHKQGTAWRIKEAQEQLTGEYATVNGDAWKINEVLLYMPKMIEKGHRAGKKELEEKGFDLFYSPCSEGQDNGWVNMKTLMHGSSNKEMDGQVHSAIVDRLSAGIELAARKNQVVHWTVQGRGS